MTWINEPAAVGGRKGTTSSWKGQYERKTCRYCDKKGLRVLPLVYSVLSSEDPGELAILPQLSGKLGKGVTDLTLSGNSKYTIRFPRDGYVYTLIERSGVRKWKGYEVAASAFLQEFAPDDEPPPSSAAPFCSRPRCRVDGTMVDIPDAKNVKNAWLLFTPTQLTARKRKEYEENAETFASQGKMQHFSPAAWLNGSTAQQHTLMAAEMPGVVAEYLLCGQQGNLRQTPLGKAFGRQLFLPITDAYVGKGPNGKWEQESRLGALYSSMRRDGYGAVVLHDQIGIAQALNDFRNGPFEGLEHYLATVDQHGVSNQHRLEVQEAIREIRAGLEKGILLEKTRFVRQWADATERSIERERAELDRAHAQGSVGDAQYKEATRKLDDTARKASAAEERSEEEARAEAVATWRSKYESRLDRGEMEQFEQTLKSHTLRAFGLAEKRAADHLKWFESDRLVGAFDVYDGKDASSGYSFAIASALCTLGASGCKPYDEKLDAWISAPSIERKNLYMRGFLYNQDDLIKAAKEEFAAIREASGEVELPSVLTGARVQKLAKGLISGFKAIDSAFGEWTSNQDQKFSRNWSKPSTVGKLTGKMLANQELKRYGLEIVVFHKVSEITRTIFRKGMGGTFDKGLVACLGGLLYARLGELTEKLAFDELMLKVAPEKLAEGHKKRSAERNRELAERKAQKKALRVAEKVDDSLEVVVEDARAKAQAKVKSSLDELAGRREIPANGYHQARIGVLLGCIEMVGLAEKLRHNGANPLDWNPRTALEIGGSIMSVGSMVTDTIYTAAKSIREVEPLKSITPLNRSADIMRGGLKLGAGVLSVGAGACSATLDFMKVAEEEDRGLRWIYFLRGATGGISGVFTALGAFSYCQPAVKHIAQRYAAHSARNRALIGAGELAGALAKRVWLLRWAARLNWIGLAFTVAEIGYLLLKDDELQNWCEKSAFRKVKVKECQDAGNDWLGVGAAGGTIATDHFTDPAQELEALDRAAEAVGL